MCGGTGKECAICALGDGNCLTSMHEDNFCYASRKQIEKRLANNEYQNNKELMEMYLSKLNILTNIELLIAERTQNERVFRKT